MSQFNLKKFLVENKLTFNSRLKLNEEGTYDRYNLAAEKTRSDNIQFVIDNIYNKSHGVQRSREEQDKFDDYVTYYMVSGQVDEEFISKYKKQIEAYLRRNQDYYSVEDTTQLPKNILEIVAEDILEILDRVFDELPYNREPIHINGKTFHFN